MSLENGKNNLKDEEIARAVQILIDRFSYPERLNGLYNGSLMKNKERARGSAEEKKES